MRFLSRFRSPSKEALPDRWIVLDTETTGLQPATDRILSIACLPIVDQKIILAEKWETFISQNYFNPTTVPVHGITQTQKENFTSEYEAMQHFSRITKNALLVGHHICFDMAFINRALVRNGLHALENKVLDTADLYYKLYPLEKIQHRPLPDLDVLCQKLMIKTHARHTAEGDAMLTALALLKLIKKTKMQPKELKRVLIKCKKIKA